MIKFKCRKSKLQEYDCQVFTRPRWESVHKVIGFDKCLADELFYLWDLGIITTGSCCGHHYEQNGEYSYIGVKDEFICKMKRLGYEIRFNPHDLGRDNTFIPRTFQ